MESVCLRERERERGCCGRRRNGLSEGVVKLTYSLGFAGGGAAGANCCKDPSLAKPPAHAHSKTTKGRNGLEDNAEFVAPSRARAT